MAGDRRAPLIYDAAGHPVRRASGYDSAGSGRRVAQWWPTTGGPNTLAADNLDLLRTRARDQVRNNPWGDKSARAYASSRVGKGIRPVPDADDAELKRQASEVWKIWNEEADADATTTFYGLQRLSARSLMDAGECFFRWRPRRPADGFFLPIQLQALEGELCDTMKNGTTEGGGMIRAGVEFGRFGRRTAYWMHPEHPGELQSLMGNGNTSRPIPAESVLHVYHVNRPGQVRGIPGMAPVLGMLREIGDTRDAFALKLKVQNLFASFETQPAEGAGSALDPHGTTADDGGTDVVAVEPGTHQVLPPGHEITFSNPNPDTAPIVEWFRDSLRAVASGAGLTYEQITGDLSDVNFSSIRAGLIELWREIEAEVEHTFNFQLNTQVWRRVMRTAILAGRLPSVTGMTLQRLLMPSWYQMPGREYVQPEQEAKAAAINLGLGLTSRTREAARRGMDVEQLDREIAADRAREERLGLQFDAATARAQPEPEPATVPEPDEDQDADELTDEDEEAAADAA